MVEEQISQADIKSSIQKFKNSDITHTNFDEWHERYESKNEIINSHIATLVDDSQELKQEIQEMENSEEEKGWQEIESVSGELKAKQDELLEKQNKILTWRSLQRKMQGALIESYFNALKAAKGMDIQKEVYKEFKSFHEEYQELMEKQMESYEESVEKIAIENREQLQQELRDVKSSTEMTINSFKKMIPEMADSLAQLAAANRQEANSVDELSEQIEKELMSNIPDNLEEDQEDDESEPNGVGQVDQKTQEQEPESEEDEEKEIETEFEPVEEEEIEDEENDEDDEENEEEEGMDYSQVPKQFLIQEFLNYNAGDTKTRIRNSSIYDDPEALERLIDVEQNYKDRSTVQSLLKDKIKKLSE